MLSLTETAVVQRITRLAACAAIVFLAAGIVRRPAARPFGFTAESAARELALERHFRQMPSADRIRDAHQYLTDQPHMAGSPRDSELAQWTRAQFQAFGLDDVEITTHEVLLPWPEEVSVEMVAPRSWRASMREDPIDGDRYTQISPEAAGIPYHAYSASGEVTAPVVYAASGNPDDYDRLTKMGIDVRGKIVLVRYSVPYSYRGFKALTAQQRGAGGILIYSDPADDGYAKGKVYPDGPWGPESHIQRGGIVYDFMVPGDPLTPGWPSLPGARRIARSDAASLPAIISAPLSYKDARVILESLGGPVAPKEWIGALPITYHVGAGPVVVRMRVQCDDRVRPIWTVTGMIRGREHPEELIVLGNHRDAWIYGGVDPSSGSAALIELARTMGELKQSGWQPRRSILFASWDAEEFTLTSSTEWGEQHAAMLRQNAIAYLNVDSAASGRAFSAAAVPALNRLITEIAQVVPDPNTHIPIAAVTRERSIRESGALPGNSGGDLVNNRLGSGSDYTVFLNFLGVPVADLSFHGPYGVYHSIYDNHNWVASVGDPGFRYHVALTQIWGLMAMRLAEADVVPLDYEPYAERIAQFTTEAARAWSGPETTAFELVGNAAAAFKKAAVRFNSARQASISRSAIPAADALSRKLVETERAFLDEAGLPDRPWYRHLIYAPKFTYAPELLPGMSEAIDRGDRERLAREAERVAAALRRATAALESNR